VEAIGMALEGGERAIEIGKKNLRRLAQVKSSGEKSTFDIKVRHHFSMCAG
jgi:hypothetical protein